MAMFPLVDSGSQTAAHLPSADTDMYLGEPLRECSRKMVWFLVVTTMSRGGSSASTRA
jgi:hypothetical protein